MTCPCGTGLELAQCCGALLDGSRQADTALALMRARYTAYVRGDIDFIARTQVGDADREQTERWSRESIWQGLEILGTEGGGPDDDSGVVEFVARYHSGGVDHAHRERAEFRRQSGAWILVDSRLPSTTYRRTERKLRPNEPCPCGSGIKYKKCCGRP